VRRFNFVLFILFCGLPLLAQPNPQTRCRSKGLGVRTDAYDDSVVDRVKPTDQFNSLITFVAEGEEKRVLRSDGDRFELLTNAFDTPKKKARQFLDALAESCHLPFDPNDAITLLQVKWETSEFTSEQLTPRHSDFLKAVA
jgi:hypothetical protein